MQNHNSRSRERNGTVHSARVADSVVFKGKQVLSGPTKLVVMSNVVNGQPPLVATEFDHAYPSKGKRALDDARPTNGSASATMKFIEMRLAQQVMLPIAVVVGSVVWESRRRWKGGARSRGTYPIRIGL